MSAADRAEIERLETLLEQLTLGAQRTQGVLSGPDAPQGQELAMLQSRLADLQSQQQSASQQLAGLGGNPAQAAVSGVLMANQLANEETPGTLTPERAEIQRLENVLRNLQQQRAGVPSTPANKTFSPTMSPEMMGQLYSAMAAGADDPAAVGQQYARAMQYNDMLASQWRTGQRAATAATTPRPIGGGYPDAQGRHTIPVWNPPQTPGGRGYIEEIKLSDRMPSTFDIGGVKYVRNPLQADLNAPNAFIPAVDPRTAGAAAGAFEEEKAVGVAIGAERAAGLVLSNELKQVHDLLVNSMADSAFDDAVGPVDQWTGRIGAMFGSAEGTLGKRMDFIANSLTRAAVADWKGAISNAELNFFVASVPQRGSHANVWRDWYANIFLPTMEFAAAKYENRIPETADIMQYVPNLSQYAAGAGVAGNNPYDELLNDPAVQEALQGAQ